MSHEVEKMVYTGEVPWHGLGYNISPDATFEEWIERSGVNYHVQKTPVKFHDESSAVCTFPGRHALYRTDTQGCLGIVGDDYKVVQPAEIMSFFQDLTERHGFQMETAGVLYDGKRVWGLARVTDDARIEIVDGDVIEPYLMLGTSFDTSMATTALFTSIRVVCKNTQEAAISVAGESAIRVHHNNTFDAATAKAALGIDTSRWNMYVAKMRLLADYKMSMKQANSFLDKLLEDDKRETEEIRESRPYKKILELFGGNAMGSEFAPATGWQMLNAVTEYLDHHRGYNQSARLTNAWFGSGAQFKNTARDLLLEAA